MNYSVIVGNIGTVGNFTNKAAARKCFNEYRKLSRSQYGRASGESVAIFRGAADSESDAELIAEFIGALETA